MSKLPTICLNMIVKNESRVIGRLLESVVPLIDSYCICDTGSTDNTKEIITNFFNEHNIKGKIVEEPFSQHYDVITFFDSLEHFDDVYFLDKLNCDYVCISIKRT